MTHSRWRSDTYNALALMAAEDTEGTVDGEEAGIDGARVIDPGSVGETLQPYSVADLAELRGLS